MNIKFLQKAFGAILILAGITGILQFLDLLPGSSWDLIWTILFTASAAFFFYTFIEDRSRWWALIPGFTLLGLDLVIITDFLVPSFDIGGLLFLGSIGLSFLAIYLFNREHWWAIIPGGVLITLGSVSVIDEFVTGDISGSVFFGGLGLTFISLYILPIKEDNLSWALIPGLILIGLGAVTSISVGTVSNLVFPVIIIIAGIIVLVKNLFNK